MTRAGAQHAGGASRHRRGRGQRIAAVMPTRTKPGCIAPPCRRAQGPCSRSSSTARLRLSRLIPAQEDYDPTRDYGAALPADQRCDPAKAYFRRGPGPAPDCARQGGIEILPRSAATGLQCEAARAPLASSGFFIASRAAQWRANPDGGYWDAPSDASSAALECRADRGRHGAIAGRLVRERRHWHGVDWRRSAARSSGTGRLSPTPTSCTPGNFLNYLRSAHALAERVVGRPVREPPVTGARLDR